jgi:hypothetical protein
LVVQGSGVGVIRGREFPIGKVSGRNASEPTRSLVNELEKPTLWSEGEGRRMRTETTEVACIISRGSRGGMIRKANSPVLETRCGGGETIDCGA